MGSLWPKLDRGAVVYNSRHQSMYVNKIPCQCCHLYDNLCFFWRPISSIRQWSRLPRAILVSFSKMADTRISGLLHENSNFSKVNFKQRPQLPRSDRPHPEVHMQFAHFIRAHPGAVLHGSKVETLWWPCLRHRGCLQSNARQQEQTSGYTPASGVLFPLCLHIFITCRVSIELCIQNYLFSWSGCARWLPQAGGCHAAPGPENDSKHVPQYLCTLARTPWCHYAARRSV